MDTALLVRSAFTQLLLTLSLAVLPSTILVVTLKCSNICGTFLKIESCFEETVQIFELKWIAGAPNSHQFITPL